MSPIADKLFFSKLILGLFALIYLLIWPISFANAKTASEIPKPAIYWSLDGNVKDMAGKHDLRPSKTPHYSTDSVKGSHSMLFKRNTAHEIVITPFNKINRKNKTERENLHFLHKFHEKRTLSLWFKTSEAPSDDSIQYLIDVGSTIKGIAIYISNRKLIADFCISINYKHKLLETSFTLGEWNHVVAIINSGKLSLYLNGKLVAFNSFKHHKPFLFYDTCALGSFINCRISPSGLIKDGPRNLYYGFIDEVKIYAIALSEENVENLFLHKKLVPQEAGRSLSMPIRDTSNQSLILIPQPVHPVEQQVSYTSKSTNNVDNSSWNNMPKLMLAIGIIFIGIGGLVIVTLVAILCTKTK